MNAAAGSKEHGRELGRYWLTFALCLFSGAAECIAAGASDNSTNSPAPSTPREFFNSGTRELNAGKLREAEASLETALAGQNERLQTPALYNLGEVRFAQGAEELKKGPSVEATSARSRVAAEQGDEAIRAADDALESDELQKIIAAYLNGRGKRRELKAAREAVLQALQAHGNTLAKWQRASGDFKSVIELDSSQTDARFNADVVDRQIAKLIDSLRQLQKCAAACAGKCDKLNSKLKQLKGRIPASQMPPGAGDDDEEDDLATQGPPQGQKEAPSRDGNEEKEMRLSPEQAGWLLEGFKLDNERRLPMGQFAPGEPRERSRKTW